MKKDKKTGTLYVISTPIGNLKDITIRALETLASVDLIACEDTRVTRRLLAAHGISKSLISYREENRERAGRAVVEALGEGRDAALVTDAGTPGISDPGQHLTALCAEEGIGVVPIPGPSSVTAALAVSGFVTDRFVFLGFLPRRGKKRETALSELVAETRTAVIFESPPRVAGTLAELRDRVGDRRAALCRELTKMYEEVVRGRLSEIVEAVGKKDRMRGEVVIVLEGRGEVEAAVDADTLRKEIEAAAVRYPEKRAKELAAVVSDRLGISSSVVYNEIVKERK
jgi:16S rRNA (cytidine1402-2'-O)-methyltransferase